MKTTELKMRSYLSYIVLAELITYKKTEKLLSSTIVKDKNGCYRATVQYKEGKFNGESELDLYAMETACFRLINYLVETNVVKDINYYVKDFHQRIQYQNCEELMNALIECGYINDVNYFQKIENERWVTELEVVEGIKMHLGEKFECNESHKDKDISKRLCIEKYLIHLCIYLNQHYIHKEDSFLDWFYDMHKLPEVRKDV